LLHERQSVTKGASQRSNASTRSARVVSSDSASSLASAPSSHPLSQL
jgi:hypothetical protein